MKRHPIRHFISNIICGFIANKALRKKVRVILNSDMRANMRFIRHDIGAPINKKRTCIGYGAQNLIIIVNDQWVYKFPLRKNNPNEIALREQRIVDAFAPISPIHVPSVKLLDFNGTYVRKYPYFRGVTFDKMSDDTLSENMDAWSTQIAKFMYVMARSDPASIRDLRPSGVRRGRMMGWCHGDLAGNFIIDPNTNKIVAIIDWEDCAFRDFSKNFTSSLHRGTEFLSRVREKYLQLYDNGGTK